MSDEDLCPDYDFASLSDADYAMVEDPVLFADISPMDILQGELGDCWLLSAIAGLAEYPTFIKKIVEGPDENGVYQVHLHSFESGDITTLEIDDAVPISGDSWDGYSPAYAHPTAQSELWPCLLEKAFAKMAGGYANIDGGQSVWAFAAMVGSTDLTLLELDGEEWGVYKCIEPSTDNPQDYQNEVWWGGDPVDTKDEAGLMDILQQYDDSKYLMCICSKTGTGSDQDVDEKNIHYGHAYTILQVANCPAGTDFHLIKLRNPWGESEWAGKWADDSPMWTDNPEVADALDYHDNDDGAFWIPIHAVSEHFSQIFVCEKSMENAATTRELEISGSKHPHKGFFCC